MLKLLQPLLPGVLAFCALVLATPAMAQKDDGLRDVTVLIVRHAEKPDQGRGISTASEGLSSETEPDALLTAVVQR